MTWRIKDNRANRIIVPTFGVASDLADFLRPDERRAK
jgi:hypothetical protein